MFLCLHVTNFKVSTSLIASENSWHKGSLKIYCEAPSKKHCKDASMCLTLNHCSIETKTLVKRINYGGGYGLEIPVQYHFLGPSKTIDWLKKKSETFGKELEYNVSKCMK